MFWTVDRQRITWQAVFSIGVDEIDSQHRKLIELVATMDSNDGAGNEEALDEVLNYASRHFADEEAFMARIGYPDLPTHRIEHKLLTRILAAHRREFESGKTDLNAFKRFVFRWVVDHVVDDDRRIGLFVRERES